MKSADKDQVALAQQGGKGDRGVILAIDLCSPQADGKTVFPFNKVCDGDIGEAA